MPAALPRGWCAVPLSQRLLRRPVPQRHVRVRRGRRALHEQRGVLLEAVRVGPLRDGRRQLHRAGPRLCGDERVLRGLELRRSALSRRDVWRARRELREPAGLLRGHVQLRPLSRRELHHGERELHARLRVLRRVLQPGHVHLSLAVPGAERVVRSADRLLHGHDVSARHLPRCRHVQGDQRALRVVTGVLLGGLQRRPLRHDVVLDDERELPQRPAVLLVPVLGGALSVISAIEAH